MTSSSFARIATETITIKRTATVVGGKQVETPTTVYSGVKCMKFSPVDAETMRRLELKSPYTLKETMIMGSYVIENGDLVVTSGSVEYQIKAVESWQFRDEFAIRLFMEESKST